MAYPLPEFIIMDTSKEVGLFRRHVEEFGKPAALVDDVLQEIMTCLKWRGRAETRIDSMVAAMLNRDFTYDCNIQTIEDYNNCVDEGVVGFVLEIGDKVREQLKAMQVYEASGTGRLLYDYYPAKKEGFNDIILKKNFSYSDENY